MKSDIQFYKALAYTRAEDYTSAVIEANSAIRSRVSNIDAHALLIIIRLREHKGEEALTALDYLRVIAEDKSYHKGELTIESYINMLEDTIQGEIKANYTMELGTLIMLFFESNFY